MEYAQLSVDEKNNGQHFRSVQETLHQDNCVSLQNCFQNFILHYASTVCSFNFCQEQDNQEQRDQQTTLRSSSQQHR